jgi:hypothetical protein
VSIAAGSSGAAPSIRPSAQFAIPVPRVDDVAQTTIRPSAQFAIPVPRVDDVAQTTIRPSAQFAIPSLVASPPPPRVAARGSSPPMTSSHDPRTTLGVGPAVRPTATALCIAPWPGAGAASERDSPGRLAAAILVLAVAGVVGAVVYFALRLLT